MSIRTNGSTASLRLDHAHPARPGAADGRIPELDAVRGLAAVAIVVYHANQARFPWGWAAVDLFFVLSGFLITSIILRHGNSRGFLPRFYARRALRIWPIYYMVVFAVVACGPRLPRPTDLRALPYDLTFTQALPLYWTAHAPRLSPYLGHTWTLAIEEQFYLLWPALVLLVGRRRVVPLAAAAVATAVSLRAAGYPISLLGARCDGLALGGLLAALLAGNAGRSSLRAGLAWTASLSAAGLLALSLSVGIAAPGGSPAWPCLTLLAFNTLWFGVVGLVAVGTGHPRLAILRSKRLRALGTISYGLYLYHLIIMIVPADLARVAGLRIAGFWRESATILACFAAAALSWKYVERPILGLKDRFAYRETEPRESSAHDPYRRRFARGINRRGRRGAQSEQKQM
jgi:peptidoglycan/LPS O-acetylase OafA/YrhL